MKTFKARRFVPPEEYQLMLKLQKGVCAICARRPRYKPYIDHNHKTGEVRGLLCCKCNTALGMADDSVDRLRNMINYLENWQLNDTNDS